MIEVLNESALPPIAEEGQRRYLRSKSDPTVLIGEKTGDCYTRRDGARWEYPGYEVTVDSAGNRSARHRGAYCDHEQYEPQSKAAA